MVVWAAFSRASIGPTARIHRACPSAPRVRERASVGSEGAGAVLTSEQDRALTIPPRDPPKVVRRRQPHRSAHDLAPAAPPRAFVAPSARRASLSAPLYGSAPLCRARSSV